MAANTDPFKEMARREKALFARLAKAPLVDLVGVVSASGAGGSNTPPERLWTLQFDFDAWRVAGGPMRTHRLSVRRKVTEKQVSAFQESIQPHAVLRIRARVRDAVPRSKVGDGAGDGAGDALLVKVLGPDRKDAELRGHAERLQKPITRKDAVFGKLTFDRRLNWFQANARWNGKPIKLRLSPDENRDSGGNTGAGEGSLEVALRVAHALWRDQPKWTRRIGDFAVKKLLALKNDTWRDEDSDEPRITPEQFRRRMKLESITVDADGSFTFWHDDGDLFWGHTIEVTGTLKRGPTHADLPG